MWMLWGMGGGCEAYVRGNEVERRMWWMRPWFGRIWVLFNGENWERKISM